MQCPFNHLLLQTREENHSRPSISPDPHSLEFSWLDHVILFYWMWLSFGAWGGRGANYPQQPRRFIVLPGKFRPISPDLTGTSPHWRSSTATWLVNRGDVWIKYIRSFERLIANRSRGELLILKGPKMPQDNDLPIHIHFHFHDLVS